MRIAVAQIGSGENKEMNRYMIERLAWSASEAGADMLFLPEYAMFCAGSDRTARNMEAAEPLDGPFVTALSELAAGQGLWICAGMYEQTDGLPYNTVVVIDDEGRLRGTHRKNRLYDAFGYRESEECRAGEQPFEPVETPAGRLGIITCYELRFPELAAEQKKRCAEVLFVPAGWVCGENKPLHWNTLLCARAIENGVTVIGADQYRADHFIGHSAVFAPDGTTLASLGAGEGLLVTEIAGTEEEEEGEWLLAIDILRRIQKASKMTFSARQASYFGRILQRLGVKSKRKTYGTYYHVVPLEVE